MDIIFNCSQCQQELAMDASGAGTEIECPTCGQSVLVPAPTPENTQASNTPDAGQASSPPKVEKHFVVPQHSAAEVLIKKPKPTLDVAAKEGDKNIRVKTIRHSDCIEVGKDKFDEIVTEMLQKIGQDNIVSLTPVTYTHLDIATRQLLTDYAIMVVFKG